MLKNTDILVNGQIPDFIRADVPRFVEFLESYYEFLSSYNLDITSLRDADLTADQFVVFLKREFADKFPNAYVNDRKLVTIVNDLYKHKGTISAIKLLFRLFYNEAILVDQPSRYLLRASDGKWQQENSILLQDLYGDFDPEAPVELRIENEYGVFFLEIDRVVRNQEAGQSRFFYKTFRAVNLVPLGLIDIVDLEGDILYRGRLIKGPSYLNIVRPGKYWKLGQVFFIPSTQTGLLPTIAMVTGIGDDGQVTSTRIIQYGDLHVEGQTVTISPYPNKPAGANFDIEINPINYNPGTGNFDYEYIVTIEDYADLVDSEISGFSDRLTENSYFISHADVQDDYMERGYVGQVEFYIKNDIGYSPLKSIYDPELTIEKWLESRATFSYGFNYEVAYQGEYATSEGQLSNPYIRLQDSYFYQLFSYVILSSVNIKEFSGVLNMIHPAGLKFFSELQKTAVVTFGDSFKASRTFSRETIYFDDAVDALDDFYKLLTFIRGVDNSVTVSDVVTRSASLFRTPTDSVSITDTGSGLEANIYNNADYFGEQYTATEFIQTIG